MNLRALLHLLGFKPAPARYGHDIATFELPADGTVQLARWCHPHETPKVVEQRVIDHLRSFLQPGDVVLDIGAHSGDTAVPLALAVGPAGRVFAVEPNPYVFPVLVANSRLNRDKTAIVPLNFAVAAVAGPIEFSYSDAGFCNGGEHQGISRWRHAHPFRLTVAGEDLETHLSVHYPDTRGRVRFVKVDAEGADLAVLQSLAGLIERERPFIRAEVHKLMPPASRVELAAWLTARGYRLYRVADEAHYQGEPIGASDIDRWRQFDLFAVPGGRSD